MIYHQRDNIRRRKKRLIQVSIVSVIIVFIILAQLFFPKFLSPLVHVASVPMMRSQASVFSGFSGFWDVLHSKEQLIIQNRNLREQLALMNAVTVERDALTTENTTLKNLLNRPTSTHQSVLAHVLSKPDYSPYDTFIIDIGTQAHVAVGDLVIVDQSIVIGEVTSVTANTANVLIYSAPGQKNDVFVGVHALETTAEGQGGGVFEIRLPKNAGVEKGDTINLAKAPDKIFGTVNTIDDTPTDSFERILFTSPVDISEISYVSVETSSTTHEVLPNHH